MTIIRKGRTKGINKGDIMSHLMYRNYKKNLTKVRSLSTGRLIYGKYNVTKQIYTKILKRFNQELFNLIIDKGLIYNIPFGLGTIKVVHWKKQYKFNEKGDLKTNTFPVDWKTTMKLWSEDEEARNEKLVVYESNKHTEGHIYKTSWSRARSKYTIIKCYKFVPARKNSRLLGKKLKDPKFLKTF
jgi:hypothetical protein